MQENGTRQKLTNNLYRWAMDIKFEVDDDDA